MQEHISGIPIDKTEAERIAHSYIREHYGTIPSIGIPELSDKFWNIPLEVKYPRVLFDSTTGKPKKLRYMKFENIGKMKIDINTGDILDKPRYYDVRNEIKDNLEFIRLTVQKALVKAGAQKFSKLPFSEHMHTPVIDIIAYILINDTMQISEEIGRLNSEERTRYLTIVEILKNMGLVDVNGDLIIPGNILVEIERQYEDIPSKLSNAMSFFFAEGYEDIQSIHQVLGPHLTISGYIYQKSIEYDDIVPVTFSELSDIIRAVYRQEVKRIKTPRYLIQLTNVGIIEPTFLHGQDVWIPNDTILEEVVSQDAIISPIKNMIIDTTVSA